MSVPGALMINMTWTALGSNDVNAASMRDGIGLAGVG